MLSVVDETDDDWQAVMSLGSWDDFDHFFQRKYIDSECFASGCTVVCACGVCVLVQCVVCVCLYTLIRNDVRLYFTLL